MSPELDLCLLIGRKITPYFFLFFYLFFVVNKHEETKALFAVLCNLKLYLLILLSLAGAFLILPVIAPDRKILS